MEMARLLFRTLRREAPLWFLFLASFAAFGAGMGVQEKDCSNTATDTTYIVLSEQPVSGLEFLTMEPMRSAGTPSPRGS